MAVTLKDDFVKEQKQWVKRAMKGRALYFGLQAQAAKKGKFLVSKKPGEVKADKVRKLEVYQGDGKDKKKADEKNTIPGGASMGVAQGANGILKLYFERGKAMPVAEKFVKHFVTREMKFKLVKKVLIAEVDALPAVPDQDAGDNEQVTAQSVEARVKELAQRSKAAGGDGYGLPDRLKQTLALASSNAGQADDALDEIEFVIGTLERAKALQDDLKTVAGQPGVAKEPVAAITRKIAEALQLVKSENVDGADDALDIAEQSIANLRKAAGLPESGTATQGAPGASKVDDAQAEAFFKDWLEGIKPDLKTLKDVKAAEFPEIGEHVQRVNDAVKTKDWKGAADAYKKADALITAAMKKARGSEAEAGTTKGLVALRNIGMEWRTAKSAALDGLRDVEAALRKSTAANADQAADVIRDLAGAFPANLDQRLAELESAADAQDAARVAVIKNEVKTGVTEYATFLKECAPILTSIEKNPLNVRVSVVSTLQGALKSMLKSLAQ